MARKQQKIILYKEAQKQVVTNKKKISFWKTLIDNDKLPRCHYKKLS